MPERRKLFRGSSRLAAQIYLFGVATILIVAVLTFSIASLMFRDRDRLGPGRPSLNSLARLIMGQVEADARTMPLETALDRVHTEFGVDISVYGPDGTLKGATLGAAAKPHVTDVLQAPPFPGGPEGGPPPGGPGVLEPLGGLFGGGPPDDGPPAEVEIVQLQPDSIVGTHAVLEFRKQGRGPGGPHMDPPTVMLLSSLIVLGITSFLLSRWLVSPLKKVSSAVTAFGAGDLTARANLNRNDELGALGKTFDQMADRISTLVAAQKELVANVSHELRTPISRIRVALDIAHLGDAASASAQLEGISADLFELEDLLESIIVSSRLDLASRSGTIPLKFMRSDPRELLREAAGKFHLVHPERMLSLELVEPLPHVEVDPKLLRRVVDNLLQNAAKYSEADTAIMVKAFQQEAELRIDVTDRGIGIAADDLERVFEPFFRTDRSRTRATGGTGLGLTLAKRVVEAHGGRIWIESAPGTGTTVSFAIPTIPGR